MELLTKNKLLTAVLAVLSVAGIGAYIFQLAGGLAVTGMSNGVSWGLYITMFMFFVGLSAGGLTVASSASVFHIKRFKAVAMPAIILSTVCICLAGMFVLIDLGGIQRIWRIVTGPNPTSPLVWDICVITLYLVINVLYLVNMRRGNDHAVSVISRFALPCAILVHSVTAWIFGLQIAKEGWYSAIMAPIFVASAMDSGLALLLCVLAALKKARLFETSRELMASLAGLLATCIAVDAFFIFCEVLTMAYPGAAGAETLALMTSGLRRRSSGSRLSAAWLSRSLCWCSRRTASARGSWWGRACSSSPACSASACGFCSPRHRAERGGRPGHHVRRRLGASRLLRTDGARSADRAGRRVGGHAGIHGPGLEAARARDRDRARLRSCRCGSRA